MTNSKWLRRALLGGVALGVTITSAQADELSALKGQIEALQSQVNQLKTTPAPAAMPNGASLISFESGQGTLGDWKSDGFVPSDSGFTVAITPTADAPAPVTQMSVSGYIKVDAIYDFDQYGIGPEFTAGKAIDEDAQTVSGISLNAAQSRLTIKTSTDTAIGQVRTLLEGDFWGTGRLRARHAWGEWDMTPNLTLGAGQTWRIGCDLTSGVTTVDFGGTAGACAGKRVGVVSLAHTSGPATFTLGIETPFGKNGTASFETAVGSVDSDPDTTTGNVDRVSTYYTDGNGKVLFDASSVGDEIIKGMVNAAAGGEDLGEYFYGLSDREVADVAASLTDEYDYTMSPDMPAIAASLQYDVSGGHQLFVGATISPISSESTFSGKKVTVTETYTQVQDTDPDTHALLVDDEGNPKMVDGALVSAEETSEDVDYDLDDTMGWDLQVGANVNLSDIATLTGHFGYANGTDNMLGSAGTFGADQDGFATVETWSFVAGLAFNVSDTTTLNVQYGRATPADDDAETAAGYKSVETIHANLLWQPVDQLRLGWEAIYGAKKTSNGTEDALRGQFGAWFFF